MLYKDITEKIIGAAMQVHNTLGNGFQEVIYQRALEIEMRMRGLEFVREMEIPIHYGIYRIGTRRSDFFVEKKIMVEIKAVITLEPVHMAQAVNYLEAYGIETGLLINFGARSLEFKRVYNNRLLQNAQSATTLHQSFQTPDNSIDPSDPVTPENPLIP